MSQQKLLLLDSASLYFRAFFGMPDTLRSPDGTPVNAVRGMLDFVATLVDSLEPDAMAACWDNDWRPAWRVELIPSYKGHRVEEAQASAPDVEETPDLLDVQVPVIARALQILGIPVVGADGYEADDVIGTLATTWDGPVDVVTGDRDLFQLVDDARGVRVLYPAKGMSKLESVDAAWIRHRYGIEPAQYADFAVLRGDPSDGLPGVAGIGEKTAATLLAAHGDLAGIVEAAADRHVQMAPRARKNLLAAADYLAVAPRVVEVVRDLPLDVDLTLRPVTTEQIREMAELAEAWGLGRPAERAVAALTAP
ncbi:5'-3' exonuclease [Mumia sp. zg.B53]|uniref:5'-3' exonuclease n=1 Tax=unclassified Mumia TaxID=2621872 RepID=UPI001C6F51E6|nr:MULTISPECIES: 5'-3' exonuclease [unclassified Mumia]MBW9205075.1 5'-3' exonuclease [Mumia sp. zg.B17]MBW9208921.1 5'-3' exonuclease [Mumia sp. zg.B21]MBW9213533.1 5'-3' exonuclease [Mumia sp. zg.B53]